MDIARVLSGYSQATRQIQIDTAMPGAFVVERFHGREAVDESFDFDIDVLSSAPFLDLAPLLGTPMRLSLATSAGERCWSGFIARAAYSDREITRYPVRLHGLLVTIRGQSAYRYTIGPDNIFHDYDMEQQGDIVSDYYAVNIRKNYKVIIHEDNVDTSGRLNWVMAQLLRDPKNVDNLPK